jgi:F-type H+-transporting ATPase subunit b
MISINATLFLQIVHLLILIFVLNRLLFQPILKLVNEREGHVQTTKKRIEELALETERLQSEYLSILDAASKNAVKERVRIKNSGISEAEESLDDSRKEVMSIRAEADKDAEREVERTQPLLAAEAATLAEEITQYVIGRRIEA